MKNVILEKVKTANTTRDKFNILRENLQCMVLKFIEERGYTRNIAFVGGTALRILYDLQRFSEDLDFSLIESTGFDFNDFLQDLKKSFSAWNIETELSQPKAVSAVKSVFLKFPHLMLESGASPRKGQKLFVKLEIDCNPPADFTTELSFNNRYLPLNVFHYDLSTLFAGKLHAVIMRQYTKGRDFYDLMWFLGKRISPNYIFLSNAIFQTSGKRLNMNKDALKSKLFERLETVDFKAVQTELASFLADRSELHYITADSLKQLIEKM